MLAKEKARGEFLIATQAKWQKFVVELQNKKRETIQLSLAEAAIITGIPVEQLENLSGGKMGMYFGSEGMTVNFSFDVNLIQRAYGIGVFLLKGAGRRMGPEAINTLNEKQPGLLNELKVKVPGFDDFIQSVQSLATPEDDVETAIQHARMAFWFESLTSSLQEGLIRPQDIFVQPG